MKGYLAKIPLPWGEGMKERGSISPFFYYFIREV